MIATLDPIVRVGDLFGGLNPESEQSRDREFEVKQNQELENIIKSFGLKNYRGTSPNDEYNYWMKSLGEFSSKSIEVFSTLIDNYQHIDRPGQFLGTYISALINKSKDKEFRIQLRNLKTFVEFLGYENNGKSIVINGNTGNVGHEMRDGKIVVNGDCNSFAGYRMEGGIIKITGYCHLPGYQMISGSIYFEGDYGGVYKKISGGNIFQNKKPIILNGQPTPGVEIKWAG